MTPLPKRRRSVMRQAIRRSTIRITLPSLIECTNCRKPTRPHRVCAFCGFYRGRQVKSK